MRRLFFLVPLVTIAAAAPTDWGYKLAGYLSIAAIVVSLPIFVTLYLHIRKTNMGHILFQPLLAIFVGFFGVLLNSILDIWRTVGDYTVDNITLVMSINRAITAVLLAIGCTVLYFSIKRHGLLSYSSYTHKPK
jgi:hypothetical protein